jgi:hypothetical protein
MIRGPIILIALGVLFAIDQFGSYSFSRTWPVLLILFGLLKLLERVVGGQRAGEAASQGEPQ